MKKILTALVLFVFAVLPMSVMAMQAISDNELSTTTGQAGVSINLDANINLVLGTVAWGDKDGLGDGNTGAGWVGISGLNSDIRIRLRQDLINGAFGTGGLGATALSYAEAFNHQATIVATAYAIWLATPGNTAPAGLSGTFVANNPQTWTTADVNILVGAGALTVAQATNFGTAAATFTAFRTANPGVFESAYSNSLQIIPLTIDVATDTTTGHGEANTTFVRIGLGSLEITVNSLETKVGLGSNPATGLNQELGSVYMKNVEVWVDGASYVDIYNGRGAGTQGVTMNLSVLLDRLHIDTLSWGDSDGVVVPYGTTPTTTDIANKAGYVGLEGLNIASLGIYGPVTIDVATSAVGYKETGHATTFVRIGFAGLNLQVGAIDAIAVIGDAKDFSGAKDTFGTIYLSGLNITMGSGSQVDIYNLYGKSGVVIDFNLNIGTLYIATLSWGDADGVTGAANAGFVGLNGLNIAGLNISGNTTIDVATVTTAAAGLPALGTTFVRIGFNNVNVAMTSLDATVAMGNNKGLSNDGLGTLANTAQELGTIYMSTLTTDIDGSVDIYAPQTSNSQGVIINMNATVSAVTIAALSWGDADGLGTTTPPITTTAGFVGLKTLALGTMNIAGKVTIDVATVQPATSYVNSPFTLMYHGYPTHMMSPNSSTFVHIGLGTGNADSLSTAADTLSVSLASLSADVALDSVKGLTNAGIAAGNSGLLGSIYVGGVAVKVNGWVDIAAH